MKKEPKSERTMFKSIVNGAKKIKVKYFETKEAAASYAPKMRTWPIKHVVRARDPETGRFNGLWALVCCK